MYFFIVNPKSRSGRGQKIWNLLEAELLQRNVIYEVFFTEYPHHATDIARNLTSGGDFLNIIILGGDGTINEFLCGVDDLSKITLGYIPTGSSNDFARDLKLPTDPHEALHIILNPKKYTYKDVGVVSYPSGDRRFSVSTGMGFDAAVCFEALRSKIKDFLNKVKLGKLTYAGIALRQLHLHKAFPCDLILDDYKKVTFKKCFFVAFMIHKYEGGGFKFCPQADYQDGYIDICVVEDIQKLKALLMLPIAYIGLPVKLKEVHNYKCKTAFLSTPNLMPVHADGESCEYQNQISVTCLKQKIRVIIE